MHKYDHCIEIPDLDKICSYTIFSIWLRENKLLGYISSVSLCIQNNRLQRKIGLAMEFFISQNQSSDGILIQHLTRKAQ